MTNHELSRYYYLSLEIKELEQKINEVVNTTVGASKITGLPHTTKVSNPTEANVELIIKLKSKLEHNKKEAIKEMLKIEEFISSIEDAEARLIFSKRYIKFKTWDVIAKELGISESTLFRIKKKYTKGGIR